MQKGVLLFEENRNFLEHFKHYSIGFDFDYLFINIHPIILFLQAQLRSVNTPPANISLLIYNLFYIK